MRVLICGSRGWEKPIPIEVLVGGFVSVYGAMNVTIIHGGARGVDSMAALGARRHGCWVELFKADWDGEGRSAGPKRNQRMLDEGKPDVVFAVTADLSASKGTADMVERAKSAGVPTYVMGPA